MERRFPNAATSGAEIHASDLRAGRGYFKGVPVPDRIALRDSWLEIARNHSLKFVYRSIEKKKFQQWVHGTFGAGVSINPYIAAFPLVALVVNEFLAKLPETWCPDGVARILFVRLGSSVNAPRRNQRGEGPPWTTCRGSVA